MAIGTIGDGDAVNSTLENSYSVKNHKVKFNDNDQVVYINEHKTNDIEKRITKAQKKRVKEIITNYLRDDKRAKARKRTTEPDTSNDLKEESTSNEVDDTKKLVSTKSNDDVTAPSGQNAQNEHLEKKETTPTKRTDRPNNFFWRIFEVRFYSGNDSEAGDPLSSLDNEDRNKFIKDVFTYLMIMMLFTVICTAVVIYTPEITLFFFQHFVIIAIISIILFSIGSCAMTCCEFARHPPLSFYFLIVVTIGCTLIVCIGSVVGKHSSIYIAAAATLAVCIVCYLLALTKFDFTKFYIYLIVFGVVIIVVSIGSVILIMMGYPVKPILIIVNLLSALFYSFTIVIELQMIFGSKALEYDTSQTAFAAYKLYSSIIFLFLRLLQILQLLQSDD